jgi:hypothetical protein
LAGDSICETVNLGERLSLNEPKDDPERGAIQTTADVHSGGADAAR